MKIEDQELREKTEHLFDILKGMNRVAVAFSGGVDSALLLKAAHEALGDQAAAVTVQSPAFPKKEYESTVEFCRTEGIRQFTCQAGVLEDPAFAKNPPNRCYICKKQMFQEIKRTAEKHQFEWIVEGSNADDRGDYRPGMQAVKELGIRSPLMEAGFSKKDIRNLSSLWNLSTWDKPAYACLATRIPYEEEITKEKLWMIERAEELLLSLGFCQMRVRIHQKTARIEILPEDFEKIMREDIREKIVSEFSGYGFSYVSLDLKGYRMGSMNEGLSGSVKTGNVCSPAAMPG